MTANSRGIAIPNRRRGPCYVGGTLFTRNVEALKDRIREWEKWASLAGDLMLKKEFGFEWGSFRGHQQGLKVTLNRTSRTGDKNAPITLRFSPGRNALVPKGIVIRLHIFSMLDEIDNIGGYHLRDDAVYAFIDGSGAFQFESLRLVLRTLLSNDETDVSLGTRPNDEVGMPQWRKAVEEFEHYILFHRFEDRLRVSYPKLDPTRRVLPDGQAGCWAFRARAARNLALTARGYEIEIDLLFSAVLAGLRIDFSEPLLMSPKPRVSDFSRGGGAEPTTSELVTCREKLEFIEHKLGLFPRDLAEAKAAFISRFVDISQQVPAQYWNLVDNFA
jgi:hypothetical protein